jgi:hypothetical protein
MPAGNELCHHCGEPLEIIGGLPLCPRCNDREGQFYNPLSSSINDFADHKDSVLITCHGATLYDPETNEIVAGVRFVDEDDPSQGHEIVNRPVYGPRHVKRRWVKKDDAHLIRRCESCQDHTIRMKRKEGPDLYIPSRKGPPPAFHHRLSE